MKLPGNSVKVGHNVNALPSAVQPATLQDDTSNGFAYYKNASGTLFYPISQLALETEPTKDLVFIRRNGVTPIAADNGAMTANIEFLTRAVLAAGIGARRGVVDFSLGPDVVGIAAPGLGAANYSLLDAGGSGVSGQVYTDANGLFRVTVTFLGAGNKTLFLKYLNEQYAVTFAVA